MNNDENNFKRLYRDGLTPGEGFHAIETEVYDSIENLFQKLIDQNYSPREIGYLFHSCVAGVASEKALTLTFARRLNKKIKLKKEKSKE